jgi:hypothetical protein
VIRAFTAPPEETCGGWAVFYALVLGGDSNFTAFFISVIAFLADAGDFFGPCVRCNSFGNRVGRVDLACTVIIEKD